MDKIDMIKLYLYLVDKLTLNFILVNEFNIL